jgi:hypothetical protein
MPFLNSPSMCVGGLKRQSQPRFIAFCMINDVLASMKSGMVHFGRRRRVTTLTARLVSHKAIKTTVHTRWDPGIALRRHRLVCLDD